MHIILGLLALPIFFFIGVGIAVLLGAFGEI